MSAVFAKLLISWLVMLGGTAAVVALAESGGKLEDLALRAIPWTVVAGILSVLGFIWSS